MPRQYGQVLDIQNYNPYVFEGTTIAPKLGDVNLLAQSIRDREQRQNQAAEQNAAMNVALGEARMSLHADDRNWFDKRAEELTANAKDALNRGDFGEAARLYKQAGGELANDKGFLYRAENNKKYTEWLDNLNNNKTIGEDTKKMFREKVKYNYEDIHNENGDVIGYREFNPVNPVADINLHAVVEAIAKSLPIHSRSSSTSNPNTKNWANKQLGTSGKTGYDNSSSSVQWLDASEIRTALQHYLAGAPDAISGLEQRWAVDKYTLGQKEKEYRAMEDKTTADAIRLEQEIAFRNKMLDGCSNYEDYTIKWVYNSPSAEDFDVKNVESANTYNDIASGSRGSGSGSGGHLYLNSYINSNTAYAPSAAFGAFDYAAINNTVNEVNNLMKPTKPTKQ